MQSCRNNIEVDKQRLDQRAPGTMMMADMVLNTTPGGGRCLSKIHGYAQMEGERWQFSVNV